MAAEAPGGGHGRADRIAWRTTRASAAKPNALQREDAFVRAVSARLDAVKAARPELEALYGALTPAQQEVFDRLWPPLPPRLGGRRADAGKPGDKELPTPPLP